MKTCFFIGHRDTGEEILPALAEAVERHITQYGVTDFYVGHYGRFDSLAARVVRDAKKRHPTVTLTLLLPYYSPDHLTSIQSRFDRSFYPPGMERIPKKIAIVRANRYLVEHSDYLIACTWHPAGSARELVAYAQKRQGKGLIQVENLAEKMRTAHL